MKIRLAGAKFFHAETRRNRTTDRRDEVNTGFSQVRKRA